MILLIILAYFSGILLIKLAYFFQDSFFSPILGIKIAFSSLILLIILANFFSVILLIKLAYFFQSDSARIDLADVWSKVQSVIQVTVFFNYRRNLKKDKPGRVTI